jgi:hypothetical protein
VLMSGKDHFHESDIQCSLWSSDLTVPDFFLWRYLKGCAHKNGPNTIQKLKLGIRGEIATTKSRSVAGRFRQIWKLF